MNYPKPGEVITKKMYLHATEYGDGVVLYPSALNSDYCKFLSEVEMTFVIPEYSLSEELQTASNAVKIAEQNLTQAKEILNNFLKEAGE